MKFSLNPYKTSKKGKKSLSRINSMLIPLMLVFILITGCSNKKDVENYISNMTTFVSNVEKLSVSINAIDPQSDGASTDLLFYLDYMDQTFSQMADVKPPKGYESVSDISRSAATSMRNAVQLYHEVYEAETFDEEKEAQARASYNYAFECLGQMSDILQNKQ